VKRWEETPGRTVPFEPSGEPRASHAGEQTILPVKPLRLEAEEGAWGAPQAE